LQSTRRPVEELTPLAADGALVRREASGVPYLEFPALAAQSGLAHGVFTRAGGTSAAPYASLNVSVAVGDERPRVLENRARIAAALGFAPERVYGARQVHGAAWRVVDESVPPAAIEREPCDILLSGAPGVLLLLKFADCTPLVLWDARRRWVAVAHAGWRGTAAGVAATAVRALRQAAGSDPMDLWGGIGPSIGGCCYEVGPDVRAAVEAALPEGGSLARPGCGDRVYLDLSAANRQQLVAAGVPDAQIVSAGRCTACEPEVFFSHRALGYPAGRFGVAAGVNS
jgi:polyphenol oxidase